MTAHTMCGHKISDFWSEDPVPYSPVYVALQNAGYNKEGATVIPVFGVDATDAAKDAIAAGSMIGTIKQDAEGMANTIAQIAQINVAAVLVVHPEQALHQCGLSSSVFAHQRMHRTGFHGKIYIVKGLYTGKFLADALHLQSFNSKVIVFDEPTSSLTEEEVEHLFRIINMLLSVFPNHLTSVLKAVLLFDKRVRLDRPLFL